MSEIFRVEVPGRDILLFIGKGGGAMKRVVYVIVGVLGIAAQGWAQTAGTGTVIGVVTDPSGGVVPAAKIELLDIATACRAFANPLSFPILIKPHFSKTFCEP